VEADAEADSPENGVSEAAEEIGEAEADADADAEPAPVEE
jgi:hypothetical protein